MQLNLLLDQIAGDLNDDEEGHELTTWTSENVRAWIVEGLGLIFDKRPDLFLENKIIKVESCTNKQNTCDCDTIRRVVGQVSKTGRLIKKLRKQSLDMDIRWTAPPCTKRISGKSFLLNAYAVDTIGDALYIYPEVPPGIEVYIEVECAVRPEVDIDTDFNVPDKCVAALKQWVLFRAKSIDAELSPAILQVVAIHKTTFYEILGIQEQTSVVIHKRADS